MRFCVCIGKADAYFCQTLLRFDLELDSMILVCPFQLIIFSDALGPVCSSLQHGDRRREGIEFGATKTYKIRFNLFEDVLVLTVGTGGGKRSTDFFSSLARHHVFPHAKRTSSTSLGLNLNDEFV